MWEGEGPSFWQAVKFMMESIQTMNKLLSPFPGSVYSVVAVALERYFHICKPFKNNWVSFKNICWLHKKYLHCHNRWGSIKDWFTLSASSSSPSSTTSWSSSRCAPCPSSRSRGWPTWPSGGQCLELHLIDVQCSLIFTWIVGEGFY